MVMLKIICTAILFSCSVVAFAHDGKKHNQHKDSLHHAADSTMMHRDGTTAHFEPQPALTSFPTLHPLVVHIPIMMLIIAALVQLFSLFVFKRELTWTAWLMLLVGFVGAYASSTWFHAHTGALPPATQHLLEEHEQYADLTVWVSGAAVVLQSVNLFFLKRRMWANLLVTLLLVASAVFVALAGHHGAELVHKHGVGAKGYLLEQHHH